jgi:nuclear transport factor 2 (NTF2) superfamily protein
MAEDAYNTRYPHRVVLVYTKDTRWRNRAEFPEGRAQVRDLLVRKWRRELGYSLIQALCSFDCNRMTVHFAYKCHDDAGQWFCSYGN